MTATEKTKARILHHLDANGNAHLNSTICRLRNCMTGEVDSDGDVWIEGPQAGHWMTEDELSRLADNLDSGN